MTDQELRDKMAAAFPDMHDWAFNLYGDKCDMTWDEQKKYPSDIPSNLELAFKAGWDAARANPPPEIEALVRCIELMNDAIEQYQCISLYRNESSHRALREALEAYRAAMEAE